MNKQTLETEEPTMEHAVISVFEVESEAYQAFSDLKIDPHNHSCDIHQAALVKRELGSYRVVDAFDDGKYSDDTFTGGILGSLIGILGGPIGVLFGGGMGLLGGGVKDMRDMEKDKSAVEAVLDDIRDDCTFLAVLVNEAAPDLLNTKLSRYAQTSRRYDAADIRKEGKDAEGLQKEMRKKARKTLRESKGHKNKE